MNAQNKKLKNTIRRIRKNDLGVIKKMMGLKALMVFAVLSFLALAAINPTFNKKGLTEAGATITMAGLIVGMPWAKRKEGAERLFNGGGGTGADNLSEEQKAFLKIVKDQMVGNMKEFLEKEMPEAERKAWKDAIAKIEKGVKTEKVEAIEKALADMGLELKAIKEKPAPAQELKTLRDQIKKQLSENKDAWDKFKSRESNSFKMELDADIVSKAAGTMLVSGNLGGSSYMPRFEIVPGVTPIARAQAFLEQYCNVGSTNSAKIVWVNKVNPDGNAAMTSEGGLKPLIDFEFASESSDARKCASKIKISEEMLDDVDYILSEIEGELRFQTDKVVDDQLLSGNGVAPNLKGLKTFAGGYTLTTISTQNPNRFDAIAAAMAQIKSLNFMPTHVFLNPIDAVNMGLTKDKNENYIFPAWKGTDGITFPGLVVVESNKITVGDFIVGDMSKFVVRNYKSFFIEWGWVNDDFEKNLVTVIGERRLHSYMSSNNTGAFVDDTFAVVQAAITAAP